MTIILLWCLFAAPRPAVWFTFAAPWRAKQFGKDLDNHTPRSREAPLGRAARAQGAHQQPRGAHLLRACRHRRPPRAGRSRLTARLLARLHRLPRHSRRRPHVQPSAPPHAPFAIGLIASLGIFRARRPLRSWEESAPTHFMSIRGSGRRSASCSSRAGQRCQGTAHLGRAGRGRPCRPRSCGELRGGAFARRCDVRRSHAMPRRRRPTGTPSAAREEPWEPGPEDQRLRGHDQDGRGRHRGGARAPGARQATTAAAGKTWDHRTTPVGLDKVKRRFALTEADSRSSRAMASSCRHASAQATGQSLHDLAIPSCRSGSPPTRCSTPSTRPTIGWSHASRRRDLAPAPRAPSAAMHCQLADRRRAAISKEVVHDVDLYLTVARSCSPPRPSRASPAMGWTRGLSVDRAPRKGSRRSGSSGARAWTIHNICRAGTTPRAPPSKTYFRSRCSSRDSELNVVSRSSRSSASTPTADPRDPARGARRPRARRSSRGARARATDNRGHRIALARPGRKTRGPERRGSHCLRASEYRLARGRRRAEAPARRDGNDFRRTARLHPMPGGLEELPAIATLLGVRVTPDTFATRPLCYIPRSSIATSSGQWISRTCSARSRSRSPQERARTISALGPALIIARNARRR